MLNWSQERLAEEAKVSRPTLVSFESGLRVAHPNNLRAIREAFEAAGVEFIAENGGGTGVRLAKPGATKEG